MSATVEYSHARHMSQVQAAAREAGLKGAAFNVLAYLCGVANFKKPIVRVSKAKIEEKTGYCEKTIKVALAALRAAGFIEPVAFATGGRGYCPVYVIRTTKGGENFPPLDDQDIAKGGKKFPLKGGKNFHKRGEVFTPPSVYLSDNLPEDRGATFGGGGERNPLDEKDKQELAIFSRDCARHGYGQARALQADRQARVG